MQYFTYEWATGDTDDQGTVANYNQFIDSLDPSSSVWRFATSVSLNDAYVDRFVYDCIDGILTLRLLTGSLQSGYCWTEISYSGASIDGEDVLTNAVSERPTEIWYDEFASDGRGLIHGFLLVTATTKQAQANEFHIRFKEFNYAQRPAQERMLPAH